jgi:hypothetical protein
MDILLFVCLGVRCTCYRVQGHEICEHEYLDGSTIFDICKMLHGGIVSGPVCNPLCYAGRKS